MATIKATPGGVHVLASAVTANGRTDLLFRKFVGHGPMGLVIANTAGGSPTVTISVQGSLNGTDWFNIPYALVATPSTFVVTNLTITSTATTSYLLQTDQPWMYLSCLLASINNETVTITAYP